MKDFNPKEFKVVALRDCPVPEEMKICDTPDTAADYWRLHVATNPYFNPECECFVALMLNTRRRVKGHALSRKLADNFRLPSLERLRIALLNAIIVRRINRAGKNV
jgi:hypothetical protein